MNPVNKPIIVPALPRANSNISGFFFCGIRLDPVENASLNSMKPNSAVVNNTIFSESLLKWIPHRLQQNKYSATKSLSETPSMLFWLGESKPRIFANSSRSISKAVPANAPLPNGKMDTRSRKSCQAFNISLQSPIMTEKPMSKGHRLGTLQMGVPGHERGLMCFCNFNKGRLQSLDGIIQKWKRIQHPQAEVGCDLIVAASSGVQFASRGADEFAKSALDGGVNIFVRLGKGKLSRRKFFFDQIKPTGDRSVLFIRKNVCLVQSRRPCDASVHILNRQTLIERQGGVEIPCSIVEFG